MWIFGDIQETLLDFATKVGSDFPPSSVIHSNHPSIISLALIYRQEKSSEPLQPH